MYSAHLDNGGCAPLYLPAPPKHGVWVRPTMAIQPLKVARYGQCAYRRNDTRSFLATGAYAPGKVFTPAFPSGGLPIVAAAKRGGYRFHL